MQRSHLPTSTAVQRGFTLVELLVAIAIISVLVGLLTWAVFPVVGTAKELEVQAELTSLEKALNDFKLEYGVLPPSSIELFASEAGWNSDPNSKAKIRRIWPNFDFGNASNPTGKLNGAECLAFFLGGMAVADAPTGFSKNPAEPFNTTGENRVGPFLEFDIARFTDTDGDGVSEYRDPLVEGDTPIYYVTSDEYDDPDFTDDPSALTGSGMTDVYRQNATVPWKSQTFQLITPGADESYGTGGVFDVDTANTDLSGGREAERDNVTNFHQGRLAP